MTDHSDDDADLLAAVAKKEPEAVEYTPVVPAVSTAVTPAASVPVVITGKQPTIEASDKVQLIVPRNLDEVYRLAKGFFLANMVPESVQYWVDAQGKNVPFWKARDNPACHMDENATVARIAMIILKGTEVGLTPSSSLATIMVINNKTTIYGDGAKAVVLASGLIEYEKVEIKPSADARWSEKYSCTVTLKRKGQSEPVSRSFSHADAKHGGLLGKKGPWTEYPERQCYWRAWTWAARDCASDALYGLSVYEEQIDIATEQQRAGKEVSLTSLA